MKIKEIIKYENILHTMKNLIEINELNKFEFENLLHLNHFIKMINSIELFHDFGLDELEIENIDIDSNKYKDENHMFSLEINKSRDEFLLKISFPELKYYDFEDEAKFYDYFREKWGFIFYEQFTFIRFFEELKNGVKPTYVDKSNHSIYYDCDSAFAGYQHLKQILEKFTEEARKNFAERRIRILDEKIKNLKKQSKE